MEELLLEIFSQLRKVEQIGTTELAGIIRKHNRDIHRVEDHMSKKKALRFYLKQKRSRSALWQSWKIDEELDARVVKTLQMKPRRTASGVATITVITKPMACTSNCLYCPNDIRMPKSYLTDEPACQRAERNYFDPYLQVKSRLKALTEMGHNTDKIELIVLGGTWCDYPREYQIWFIRELFRALNSDSDDQKESAIRRDRYRHAGISNDPAVLDEETRAVQKRIDEENLSYNEAARSLYDSSERWQNVSMWQSATFEELEIEHSLNESCNHRVVGLVVETRPDTISEESLNVIRRLGCTKVQMGVQTLNPELLRLNNRSMDIERVCKAFELLRLFGFKVHAHFMLNLYGANTATDLADYRDFATNPSYSPDEVKIYPCVLVKGTGLESKHDNGSWVPYDEESLVDLLAECILCTPPHTRISRMIRDISAHDIVSGCKKTNLRQMVEDKALSSGRNIDEIRLREISTQGANIDELSMTIHTYDTTITREFFLQWVTAEKKIAGFLRLSLPQWDHVGEISEHLPVKYGEAMIREVHVYGRVAKISETGFGAQHLGLGKQLVEKACDIAKSEGYQRINVISAIGTREYYRKLGFSDNGLYQQKSL